MNKKSLSRKLRLSALAGCCALMGIAAVPAIQRSLGRGEINNSPEAVITVPVSETVTGNAEESLKLPAMRATEFIDVSETPVLYGIYYNLSGESVLEDYELYSFNAGQIQHFQRECPKVPYLAAQTATLHDGKLYCFSMGTVNIIDVASGKILEEDIPFMIGNEMANPMKDSSTYDPSTGLFYMLYWSVDGTWSKALMSWDPVTHKITELGNLSDTRFTQTMAVSPEGKLYTIMFGSPKSSLVEIDKTNAQCTEITDDILEGDSFNNVGLHSVSSVFDFSDGMMYVVAGSNSNNNTYIVRIDPKTGKGVKLATLPGKEYFMALSIARADNDAPGFATEMSYEDGAVKFTAPAKTYNGKKNLSGTMTAYVKVRDGEEYTKSVTPGEKVSMDITLPSGQSIVEIAFGNASGKAPFRRMSVVVDDDVPGPVHDLSIKLIGASNEVSLSWTKPTTALHGGVFKDEDVRYRITRYPDLKVVSENQSGTTFTDRLPETHAHYYYGITSMNIDRDGETVFTDKVLYGSTWEAPYVETFDTQSDFDYFTVIDADKDGVFWTWDSSWNCGKAWNDGGNDYLVTPKVNMKKDIEYLVNIHNFPIGGNKNTKIKISVGTKPEITGKEQPVAEINLTDEASDYMSTFNVPADDIYYIFIQANGRVQLDRLEFDIYSYFSAPAAVENLNVTAGERGELYNTIKFNAPTKTFKGNSLSKVSKIEIYRDGSLEPVKVFDNPSPGMACEWTDEEVRQGNVSYKIIPYNEVGQGQFVTNTNWVGLDIPADVSGLKYKMNADAKAEVTFDKASGIGSHGGYVDPEAVTYTLYRYDPYLFGLYWEEVSEPTKELKLVDTSFKLDAGKRQQDVTYKLVCRNKAGESEGKAFSIVLGKPYKTPYSESWPNCMTDKGPWRFDGAMFPQPWSFADGVAMAVKPYDNDKGMMMWTYINEQSTIGITRGPRLNLTTVTNPEISFMMWHGMEAEPEDLALEIFANYDDEGWNKIAEVPYNNGMTGWGRFSVALDGSKSDVQIGFKARAVDASAAIYLDLLKLDRELERDLCLQSITIEKNRVEAGEPVRVTACVSNYGSKAAENYTVSLRRDNKVIQTKQGEPLKKSNDMIFYTFEIPTSKTDAKSTMNFDVVAGLADDQNEDNDKSAKLSAYIHGTAYPAPTNLVGNLVSGKGVELSWDQPEESSIPVEKLESFETYESFIIDEIGDWVTYDGDGELSIYLSTPAVPHSFEPQAWQVWAPAEASVDINIFPTLAPVSGDKLLVSWGASDGTINSLPNDDWLISPEIKGGSDISFYYRQPLELYAPAKFEILYSTTDQDPIEFEVCGSGEAEDAHGYYFFEFTLPDDAKYFAIRSCSTGNYFAAMLDDLTYTPIEGETKSLTFTGYNLYRNGEVIARDLKETKYTDTDAHGDVIYHVSAVWKEGESNPFGPCAISASVNESLADSSVIVKAIQGGIYVKSANGTDVAIATASGLSVFNSHVNSDAVISLEPGVYLVKAGAKTHKVIVK